ncbi:CpsD/CapB family tyrosine-protein kinase [Bacillus paranthracis]|uniref:CpsD/CapB family tyrosine-protein kinase n=1 Tax=Bacillus paranthracis TaxID=2026186 RepID=UPI0029629E03|nr:CpsD/CapB family tyrosine-protein kinase [Bacillus cereus]
MFKRKTAKRKLIAHKEPKSTIAEQFRNIRTNLQFAAVGNEMRSIMITSPDPEEGKTTIISNLAVVLGQQGKKVLVMGADLRKPTVQNVFGVHNTEGLTNVLSGQSSFADCVQETVVDNVYVISAGPIPPNPAELLATKRMDEVLLEAYELFDIVLVDTPPVLVITDAQILANKCDGVILVIRSEQTEKERALKSKQALEQASGKLLGVILNDKKMNKEMYGYY